MLLRAVLRTAPSSHLSVGSDSGGRLQKGHFTFTRGVSESSVPEILQRGGLGGLAKPLGGLITRQYESSWNRFQNRLADKPHSFSSSVVASFLVHCSKKLSTRTVLTIRAALALPLLKEPTP